MVNAVKTFELLISNSNIFTPFNSVAKSDQSDVAD